MSEELARPQWGFALRGEGTDTVEIDVYDAIGDYWGDGSISARTVRNTLRSAQDAKTIKLKVNSLGGEVFDGLAIYNQLKNHSARKVVEIDGVAASMASILAMAGDEIHMPEASWMMIHNPWGFGIGESGDIRALADLLDKQKAALVNIYAERTGVSAAKVAELMDAETWMSGKEAVDLGFATKVVSQKQSKAATKAFASARKFGFINLPQPIADQLELPTVNDATQPALIGPGTTPDEGKEPIKMAEKDDNKVEVTPSIARALGCAAGSPESEVLAAAARCRELEIQVMTLTGSTNSSEALGAVRGPARQGRR
jgi:ATP-dependent Clp endopeptidase proteolytic subunit ClpP